MALKVTITKKVDVFEYLFTHVKQYDMRLYEALRRLMNRPIIDISAEDNEVIIRPEEPPPPVVVKIDVPILTYAIGIGGPQALGTDIANPLAMRRGDRTVTECWARADIAPTVDILLDVFISQDFGTTWLSIFTGNPPPTAGPIILPAGLTDEVTRSAFVMPIIPKDAWIRLDQDGGDLEKATLELWGHA